MKNTQRLWDHFHVPDGRKHNFFMMPNSSIFPFRSQPFGEPLMLLTVERMMARSPWMIPGIGEATAEASSSV